MLNLRHRRSPKNLTIDDIYPDWIEDGAIFADFVSMPWSETVVAATIGMAYCAESANRFIAPLVYKLLDEDGELDSSSRTKLANIVKTRFIQKWTHLWNLYSAEYNPLDTYNLTESSEKDSTDNGNETLAHGHVVRDSGTDSRSFTHGHVITNGGEDTIKTDYGKVTTDSGEPSSVTTNQREGFNSDDFQNVTKESTDNVTDNTETLSGTDTSTTEYGGTETHSGIDTDATLYGKSETHSGSDTTTKAQAYHEEYSSTKAGLMYRAPAELMSIDREFWLDDYFSIVFADINSILTLAVYAEKEINTKIY